MSTIEHLHEYGSRLWSAKLKQANELKQKLLLQLQTVEQNSHGKIDELWTEIVRLHTENKHATNAHAHDSVDDKATQLSPPKSPRKRRSRKRKLIMTGGNEPIDSALSSCMSNEPPHKRHKIDTDEQTVQTAQSDVTHQHSNSAVFDFKRKTSLSLSTTHKHRKLTMSSTPTLSSSVFNSEQTVPSRLDTDDEHYLHKMLCNAEQTLDITNQNMHVLQQCIDSIEHFKDKLDGDILGFGDEMRKTYQEFPFKTITPSYHEKILQEQLRLNRMLEKYPNLQETEKNIYRIQANYESQYKVPTGSERESVDLPPVEYDTHRPCELQQQHHQQDEKTATAAAGYNSDDEQNKWCVCREPSAGDMIQCDNQNCKTKWFHWKCVGILKIPKHDWYCKACRKNPTKSSEPRANVQKQRRKPKQNKRR